MTTRFELIDNSDCFVEFDETRSAICYPGDYFSIIRRDDLDRAIASYRAAPDEWREVSTAPAPSVNWTEDDGRAYGEYIFSLMGAPT